MLSIKQIFTEHLLCIIYQELKNTEKQKISNFNSYTFMKSNHTEIKELLLNLLVVKWIKKRTKRIS
jgi:hypothetical protein